MIKDNFSMMANEDIIRTIASTGKNTHVMDSEGVNNSLAMLARMDEEELMKIKGIGKKKARQIMAAVELGKRLFDERFKCTQEDCGTSIALYQHLRSKMQYRTTECAYIVVMNQNFKVLATIKISEGGITETAIDVRTIMKHVFLNNGTILALAHSHPSNSHVPSKADDEITAMVAKACDIMRIFFMDHIIISDSGFYSYYDKGKL